MSAIFVKKIWILYHTWILLVMTDHTSQTPKAQVKFGTLVIRLRLAMYFPSAYNIVVKVENEIVISIIRFVELDDSQKSVIYDMKHPMRHEK